MKSGGAPPQSKTLARGRWFPNIAKRLGVRQCSGGFPRKARCANPGLMDLNPVGIRLRSQVQDEKISPFILEAWYLAIVSEFQEIASSGGKIELLYRESDGVALRFTHANPYACAAIQMGVSLDGARLEYWPIYGVDQRPPQPAELKDRQEREVEWERLSRCISDFEAMARDIQKQLLLFPTTPKRKKDVEGISFQNILKANASLLDWFGFEMLSRFPEDDKAFLNRMFNRRHVLTHIGGRIDQEYLDNTGDTTVRLNQKVVVRSNEIRRLIPLLRTIAQNLFQGFESIA
jgi:hypothetical protein